MQSAIWCLHRRSGVWWWSSTLSIKSPQESTVSSCMQTSSCSDLIEPRVCLVLRASRVAGLEKCKRTGPCRSSFPSLFGPQKAEVGKRKHECFMQRVPRRVMSDVEPGTFCPDPLFFLSFLFFTLFFLITLLSSLIFFPFSRLHIRANPAGSLQSGLIFQQYRLGLKVY